METEPRIYVACLASYNAGTLHGKWINANQDADDIAAEVTAMLAESPEPGAEEWAIHDSEGFYGLKLGESDSWEAVATLAASLAEHGPAYAAYIDCVGADYATSEGFEDAYRGNYDSEEGFGWEFYTDCNGDPTEKHGELAPYMHHAVNAWSEDLFRNGGYDAIRASEYGDDTGVYVFDTNG